MLFDQDGPGWGYEEMHILQEPASGLRSILVVHSTRRGPAFGGIRRLGYASEADAVADASRLAGWMSRKCALAELPAGGAKMVVLDHPGLDRRRAFEAIGRHIDRMQGQYVCGPDVGTSEEDLDAVRRATRWVNPKGNDAARSTARGVLAGLRGTLQVLDGDSRFDGRTFLVQGVGAVGSKVATVLLDKGAAVLVAEPDDRLRRAATEAGMVAVPPGSALTASCDVLVPCALGGILTPEAVPRLQARAICGSANDQLATTEVGTLLQERGILYAPDIVVNSGAVIEGFYTVQDGATDAVRRRAFDQIDRIEGTVQRLLFESREREIPPGRLAAETADRRIAAAVPSTE